jgi:hypothetical protein
MPDYGKIEMLRNVELLMALYRSLSASFDELTRRVAELESKQTNKLTLNGQRRTHQGN